MPPARKRAPAKAAAPVVDPTVKNQESPGSNVMVDRHPDPVIMEAANGVQYDISKGAPELVQADQEEVDARRARARQTDSVVDAKNIVDSPTDTERKYIVLEFVASGLTVQGKVWKRGEVLRMEDTEATRKASQDTKGNVWYELSADDQQQRYGHVKFERR